MMNLSSLLLIEKEAAFFCGHLLVFFEKLMMCRWLQPA
ncbi:hypothetical protein SanJ4211_0083 [Streptococcus anginosus]|nr:hypothetical protein SanJ4211_0083 [Streptococcus anginosus]